MPLGMSVKMLPERFIQCRNIQPELGQHPLSWVLDQALYFLAVDAV